MLCIAYFNGRLLQLPLEEDYFWPWHRTLSARLLLSRPAVGELYWSYLEELSEVTNEMTSKRSLSVEMYTMEVQSVLGPLSATCLDVSWTIKTERVSGNFKMIFRFRALEEAVIALIFWIIAERALGKRALKFSLNCVLCFSTLSFRRVIKTVQEVIHASALARWDIVTSFRGWYDKVWTNVLTLAQLESTTSTTSGSTSTSWKTYWSLGSSTILFLGL